MNNIFLYYLLLSTAILSVVISAKHFSGDQGKYLSVFEREKECALFGHIAVATFILSHAAALSLGLTNVYHQE